MDIRDIDWNQACRERKSPGQADVESSSGYWDKRARFYARQNTAGDYVGKFLRFLKVRPDWSVLDIGCATGTVALPLARRVREITAVDISSKMLDLLGQRCRELAVGNISIVQSGWEDDWAAAGIGVHDVAIASRSLITDDYRGALAKLDAAARKRVYVSTIVGDGPHDRRIMEAIGRTFNPGPDYIYIVNLLYQMGIRASVNFLGTRERSSYASPGEAYEIFRLKIRDINPAEEKALAAYLQRNLLCRSGQWRLAYRREIKWAVLWWDKG